MFKMPASLELAGARACRRNVSTSSRMFAMAYRDIEWQPSMFNLSQYCQYNVRLNYPLFNPDAAIAEADDISASVARKVGEEAWMLVHPPPAGVVAEICHDELRGLEGAIAVVEADPDAAIAKADDISASVARKVGEETWMLVHPPPAGVVAEILNK